MTMNRRVNDMRSEVDVIKRVIIQQDPQIAPSGSLVTRSQENWKYVREDIIIAGGDVV